MGSTTATMKIERFDWKLVNEVKKLEYSKQSEKLETNKEGEELETRKQS